MIYLGGYAGPAVPVAYYVYIIILKDNAAIVTHLPDRESVMRPQNPSCGIEMSNPKSTTTAQQNINILTYSYTHLQLGLWSDLVNSFQSPFWFFHHTSFTQAQIPFSLLSTNIQDRQ